MESVITIIDLDLYSPTCYEVVKAQQGDTNLRKIKFNIYDNGEPYNLSLNNVVVKVEGVLGDGVPFMEEPNVIDNVITYTLTDNVLYADGIVKAKLVFYEIDTESVLSTISFRISVQKDYVGKNEIVKRNSTIINDMIFQIEKNKQQISSMSDEIYTTSDIPPENQKDGDYWTRLL